MNSKLNGFIVHIGNKPKKFYSDDEAILLKYFKK